MAKKVLSYTVQITPAEEGGYWAMAPALEGCYSQGDTPEEAERNIREAIELYVETLVEDGLPIPEDCGTWVKQVQVSVAARPAGSGA